jgi:signal transduction histidine kinase
MVYLILLGVILYYSARAYDRRKKADLDEQKMRFLIDATHDIRSPLTLIMAPLKKLKERITDKESRSELTIIEKNAQRLLLLVNRFSTKERLTKTKCICIVRRPTW